MIRWWSRPATSQEVADDDQSILITYAISPAGSWPVLGYKKEEGGRGVMLARNVHWTWTRPASRGTVGDSGLTRRGLTRSLQQHSGRHDLDLVTKNKLA